MDSKLKYEIVLTFYMLVSWEGFNFGHNDSQIA